MNNRPKTKLSHQLIIIGPKTDRLFNGSSEAVWWEGIFRAANSLCRPRDKNEQILKCDKAVTFTNWHLKHDNRTDVAATGRYFQNRRVKWDIISKQTKAAVTMSAVVLGTVVVVVVLRVLHWTNTRRSITVDSDDDLRANADGYHGDRRRRRRSSSSSNQYQHSPRQIKTSNKEESLNLRIRLRLPYSGNYHKTIAIIKINSWT